MLTKVLIAPVALAATAIVALAACGSTNNAKSSPATAQVLSAPASSTSPGPTISVAGHGTAKGKPDTATVTLGVQTNDASAQAALQKNNAEAAALIAALKAKRVADADIQTSDLSISPNWDNHGHITGYGVSNTVTVTLHDLGSAGAIIDDAAAKVGNDIRFQGVAFSIDNQNPLLARARADAVKDAMAQAQQLAQAAGVKLGAIRTIDDTATSSPQPMYYAGKAADSLGAVSMPIEAGSQELTFDVNVVYDISS